MTGNNSNSTTDMSLMATHVVDLLKLPDCAAGLALQRAEKLRASGKRPVVFFRMPAGWQVLAPDHSEPEAS